MVLFFAGLISGPAGAETSQGQEVKEAPKLVGASSNNFPPVNMQDDNGELVGFGRELSDAVVGAMGGTLTHIHSPHWPQVLEWLSSGEADFIHDTGFIEERLAYLDYSDPILEMPEVIFVADDGPDIAGIDDLAGRTVACVNEHITHIYLRQFPEINCQMVKRPIDGLLALLSGDVEAFPFPKQVAIQIMNTWKLAHRFKIVGQPLRPSLVWHMTVKKGNQKVLNILNEGIRKVKSNGEYDRIYRKWFIENTSTLSNRETLIILLGAAVTFLLAGTILTLFLSARRARTARDRLADTVTEIRKMDTELRESEQRFRDFTDSASDWYWETGPDLRFTLLSEKFERVTGVSPTRVIGRTREELGRPDPDDPWWACHLEDLHVRIPFRNFCYSVKRTDGSLVHFSASGVPVFDDDGTFKGYRGTGANITARVNAETEAVRSRALLESGIEAIKDGFAVFDADDKLVLSNEQYRAMHSEISDTIKPGVTFEEITRATVYSGQYPDTLGQEEQWVDNRIQAHKNYSGATILPMSNGRWYLVGETRTPDGHRVCLNTDITEIKQHEQAARESEEQLHLILDSTSEGVYGIDMAGNCTFCNSAGLSILGYGEESDLLGKNMHDLIHHTRVDGTPYPVQECKSYRAYRKGNRTHVDDEVLWRKDGGGFPAEYRVAPMYREGHPVGAVVTFSDITQRKTSEARLQNAQKMEAVGQLTGGIAHDFNNLLTIILGNLRLLSEILPISEKDTLEILNDTVSAADDGAQLTKSLLAFSRTRSQKPQWTDVNELLDGFSRLLHHTFQEDIDIRILKDRNNTPAFVDRTQLESALLNLAINARDAMPRGGTITIETSMITNRANGSFQYPDLAPGNYIAITVSDTGTGISPQHLDHVLEPFFTTKEVGQGSGLGLSMAYGFAKQSGGDLRIASQPNEGTKITILLPEPSTTKVLDHVVGSLERAKAPDIAPGEGETILIVEDEKRLLQFASRALGSIGYRVLTADSAVSAVSILETDPAIDLVFSDIVMPGGMTGRDLAGWVAENRPQVKVLLTSGFSNRAGVVLPEHPRNFPLLKKPYTKEQVADRIYTTLHESNA